MPEMEILRSQMLRLSLQVFEAADIMNVEIIKVFSNQVSPNGDFHRYSS